MYEKGIGVFLYRKFIWWELGLVSGLLDAPGRVCCRRGL